MRALAFTLLACCAGSASSQAASGSARIEYLTTKSVVGPTIGTRGNPPATTGSDARFSVTSPTLAAGVRLGASFTRREGRNDAFLVAPPELGGVETPLAALEPPGKNRAGVSAEQELGIARWSFLHEQDVSHSLVAEKYYEGSLRFGAAEHLTQYGLEFQRRRTDQPASRYVHPVSFRGTDRPGVLNEERNTVFVEQVLAESWKARFLLHNGRVSQVRPIYSGAELRQSFALGRKWFPQLSFGRITEDRGDPLEDDRGDAVHTWIDAGTFLQVGGRTLLKGAISLVREEELRRPGFGDATATLTALTIGWDYRLGNKLFALSARAAAGERGYSENLFQGGITWELEDL